jgi:hypothetical protein
MYELNDLEKAKIIQFNADPEMVEAVRKVILASMYSNGTLRPGVDASPMTNAAFAMVMKTVRGEGVMTNEEIGQDLRGLAHGVMLLESGFKRLEAIKPVEVKIESTYNEAI